MKRVSVILLAVLLLFIAGCKNGSVNKEEFVLYNGPYSDVNGVLVGVDDLGRELSYLDITEIKEEKLVGIFYFLWQGQHGTAGPYDITKILKNNPDAILSEKDWKASGGGGLYEHHFWGEPLFGYYTSDDTWVMTKHVQMLTDSGVDFIVFDTTNGFPYSKQALKLFEILDKYHQQDFKVPKCAFYTSGSSGKTMNAIYKEVYKRHPEYSHIWLYWDGKPMIIGDPNDPATSQEVKDFFRIKQRQWPDEKNPDGSFKHYDDGFPWISFEDKQWVFRDKNGNPELMSVSVAQHLDTIRFSSDWYTKDHKNRSRNYHNGRNDDSEDAYLYGYNFAEQFEYALSFDPRVIFITGWNEWVAQRQPGVPNEPIVFVDCADLENSRDIEPMQGYYGDNYYMQMTEYIRKFKGAPARVNTGKETTIDISGDFSQWQQASAVYKDYINDIVNRDERGFGKERYINQTGKNDFDVMCVIHDAKYVYFYVKTVDDIQNDTNNSMTLFINSGQGNQGWKGYDFVVNRLKGSSGLVIEKFANGYSTEKVGEAEYKKEGNEMHLRISKELLGIKGKIIDIQFKWADNFNDDDIFSFYTDGDCAPYGRMNYLFSNKVKG